MYKVFAHGKLQWYLFTITGWFPNNKKTTPDGVASLYIIVLFKKFAFAGTGFFFDTVRR